ncbi:MAG: helix-turn-helix domain-containing protein [Frankiaceae bacterium]
MATIVRQPVGESLRLWRERRGQSQLALATEVGISARHLSFVETGRSTPGREVLLRLADALRMPARDCNELLVAAGYAPIESRISPDSPEMASVRAAIRQVLVGHEPFPALAVDRYWNLVELNAGVELFTDGAAPFLLEPPMNVLRLALHPQGMAPRIVNLTEWGSDVMRRLRRRITMVADPYLVDLYEELSSYPGGAVTHDEEPSGPDLFVPLQLRDGDRVLTLLSIVTVFGTPRDVTVSELALKTFLPGDAATTTALLARRPVPAGGSS